MPIWLEESPLFRSSTTSFCTSSGVVVMGTVLSSGLVDPDTPFLLACIRVIYAPYSCQIISIWCRCLFYEPLLYNCRCPFYEQFCLSLIHISEPTRLGMISYA